MYLVVGERCLGCGVVSYLVDRIRDRVDCFVGHGSNPQLAFTCASLCSVESFTATDTTDRFVAPHVVFNVDNDNVPRMFSIYRLNEQSTANGVAYNSTLQMSVYSQFAKSCRAGK